MAEKGKAEHIQNVVLASHTTLLILLKGKAEHIQNVVLASHTTLLILLKGKAEHIQNVVLASYTTLWFYSGFDAVRAWHIQHTPHTRARSAVIALHGNSMVW